MKKSSRRIKEKYPALNPAFNLRSRQEEVEDMASYKDQLTDKEKDWLNRFSEEYVSANLSHKGKKLHRKVHHKKAIYKKNNARNQCVLTRTKASNELKYLEDLKTEERLNNDFEENIIDKIDGEEF